jgi:GAF domain-containing protein
MEPNLVALPGSASRRATLRALELLEAAAEPGFDRLTRLAARLLRVPVVLLVLLDGEREFLKSQFGLGEPWVTRREMRLGTSLGEAALLLGGPLVVDDVRAHPTLKENAELVALGCGALIALPLIMPGGHAIGAFCVVERSVRDWQEHEIAGLSELAETVVAEIEARTQAAEYDRASRAARLQEGQRTFFELLATGAPLPIVLKALAHMAETQLRGGLCSILLLDEEGRHLRHAAAPTLPAAYTAAIDGAAIGPAAGSCGTAAFRGETVIVADIAGDPLWDLWRGHALPLALRACWSTPIRDTHGAVVGTFAIYYRQPRAPSADELRYIEHCAHLVAVALDRRRAEEDNERLIAQLRDAIANVKTLRGLLPICSACKKIRDDGGYWNQIESYIQAHADVDFTHSICPDCARRLYGELG